MEPQEYVRFSYCVSTENIIEGCRRIKAVVEGKPYETPVHKDDD